MEKRISRKKAMDIFYNEPTQLGVSFIQRFPKNEYTFFLKPGLGFFAKKRR